MSKKTTPKLIVVFDTNVLFTQVASDLLRHEVKKTIQENSSHPDLDIAWYLPEIVVAERKYQMLAKSRELLPNLYKLEKLIGHGFAIAEDTLELHVDKAISNELSECSFKTVSPDTTKVDWLDIIQRSVNRHPPFEAGDKEKGFRDAIIGQSFLKLVQTHPITPNICRLALVSEDGRLKEYVKELTSGQTNIRILSNLDELESLINTLVSTVSEEFADELSIKAKSLFFTKDYEKSVYYKEKIRDQINQKFADQLSQTFGKDRHRSQGTWWVSNPIFIKKDRQKIYWVSVIEPEFEIYHYEYEAASKAPSGPAQGLTLNTLKPPTASTEQKSLSGLLAAAISANIGTSKKIVDFSARDKFEVHWSTTITASHNLTNPTVEKIEYLGNDIGADLI